MSGLGLLRALQVFWYAVLFFLYVPLAVVVLFSFNSVNSPARFAGFSLRWYERLLGNDALLQAFKNSLALALSSSMIAVLLGAMLGYGMYRFRHWRLHWLVWFIYLPIVMPDVVYGISEMTFFIAMYRSFGIFEPGLGTMIIAHVSFQIPFVALLVYSRLLVLDPLLFEACADLYASPIKRVWYFLLPVLWPALLAAFLLAFTLSIDDFVISFFTAGPGSTTLPIYVWSAIRKGITPEVNAIAALMIAAVVIAALMALAYHHIRFRLTDAKTLTRGK